MKLQLLSILGAALLISSCTKSSNEELTGNTTPNTLSNARVAGKPFKGAMMYHYNSELDLTCDCQEYTSAGTFSGTGNITVLGLTTSDIKPCAAPIFAGGAFVGNHVGVECASFVAANGDKVYLYTHPYDVVFTAAGLVGHPSIDIIGGTGRFSAATGSFTATLTILTASDAALTDINGTISY